MKLSIPEQPGVYALHLKLVHTNHFRVGKLGEFIFPPGDYVYIGSAMGPGGLQARLNRHLSGDGRPHWHIDWIRAVTEVIGYCWSVAGARYWQLIQERVFLFHASVPAIAGPRAGNALRI
jgi:hypothetical protein